MNIKEKLLEFIDSQSRAVTPKEAFAFVGEDNKVGFKKAVKELKSEAKLIENNKGKYMSPKTCNFVPAKVVSYSSNFVFAKPLDGGNDIYIPIEKSKGALVDDIIMVNRIKDSKKGLSGVVERIVNSGDNLLTGTAIKDSRGLFFTSSKYKLKIPVKKNHTLGAANNDQVQVELCTNKNQKQLFAKIIKVYGQSSCAKICADAVIDENGIPNVFSDEAVKSAKDIFKSGINEADLTGRLDLRDELVFTIDGADAKDLDDAISIKKDGDNFILGVHIADVSHYIKRNSVLDKEAKRRGTSVYFADRVIPMFPTEISNGICSLNAKNDRLTFSAIITLDASGAILSYEFKKSVINSKVRGVYSEINYILNNTADKAILNKYKSVLESISFAKQLSDLLTVKSVKRGMLDLETSETKFTLNEKGVCINVEARERGESEEIIENFMILANECAANLAKKSNVPFIYRVHETPNPDKILKLNNFVEILGFKMAKGILTKPKPSHFVTLLKKARKTKYSRIISDQVLRTMSKARYFEKPLGHFGLALKDYCHFTSPIRRYPDVSIHRILSDLANNTPIDKINSKYEGFVKDTAYLSSIYEVRALKAERDTEKYYMAEFMAKHIGKEFSGTISGMLPKGIFVELDNTVEGFIDLEKSSKDKFIFDGVASQKNTKTGEKLTIGDTVKIKVETASVSRGLVDFSLIL